MNYPVTCPICKGHGSVKPGFYRESKTETKCRPCAGNGVLYCTGTYYTTPYPYYPHQWTWTAQTPIASTSVAQTGTTWQYPKGFGETK